MAEFVQIERIRRTDYRELVVRLDKERMPAYRESQFSVVKLSTKLANRVTVPPETPVPECTSCGVCCLFAMIVPVSLERSKALPKLVKVMIDGDAEVVSDIVLPRKPDTSCVYLRGEFGKEIGCEVYPKRPDACRVFDAGSDRCHEFRRMYGVEPQLSAEQVAAANAKLDTGILPEVIEDVAIVSVGTIERILINADGEMQTSTIEELAIVAFFSDEEPHELHRFECGKENWLESDLLNLTREEALAKIAEQAG